MKKRSLAARAGRITRKIVDGIFILAVCSIFAYGFIYLLFLAEYDPQKNMTQAERQKRAEILAQQIEERGNK